MRQERNTLKGRSFSGEGFLNIYTYIITYMYIIYMYVYTYQVYVYYLFV